MALPDAVLKNFFDSRKRPLFTPISEKEGARLSPFHRYRVFDDPVLQEELDGKKLCHLPEEKENNTKTAIEPTEKSNNTPKPAAEQLLDKPRTNPGQTEDKLKTNQRQTRDKLGTKVETNQRQTRDKPETNWGQKNTLKQESGDKVGTKLETEVETNWGQSRDKLVKCDYFSSLVGLERKIVFFIYENCKVSRNKITNPLSVERLSVGCQATVSSVKKTVQRLEKKKIILRKKFKNGRAGWTQYELSDTAFQDVIREEMQDKLGTNWGQSRDKLGTKLETSPLSSSSSYINTTTTNGIELELSPDWRQFDFSSLEDIGFGKPHLLQIQKKGLINFQTAQESAYAFAFDLKRNQKAKSLNKTPLEFFMGILSKGTPYAPPENYEAPKDEAMRQYEERLQALKEKREQTEKRAMELAFDEWFSGLTLESQKKIFPSMLGLKNEAAKRASFMHHFRENIWPEERVRNGG